MRVLGVVSLAALFGCNAISGVGDLRFDGAGSGGAGVTSTSTSTASTSSGAGGEPARGGGSGTGGGGGVGGGRAVCGNGVIEPGEECDGGPGAGLGCDGCEVVCDGPGEVLEPTSHHCYYRDLNDTPLGWDSALGFCEEVWGGHLLILETLEEFDFLLPGMPQPTPSQWFFLGATDVVTEGEFMWIDGTPVTFPPNMPPWMPARPNANGDCVVWRVDPAPAAQGLGDLDCNTPFHPFCERPPPGSR